MDNSEKSSPEARELGASKTRHCYLEVAGTLKAKANALREFLESARPSSAIVLCKSRSDTKLIETALRLGGVKARRLNSEVPPEAQEALESTITATTVLVATLSSSFALSGGALNRYELLVNYEVPEDVAYYMERTEKLCSRTCDSTVLNIVGPRDFGVFHSLKKSLDFEMYKLGAPSREELADGNFKRLCAQLESSAIEPRDVDLICSGRFMRFFLSNSAGEFSFAEGKEELFAKLLQLALSGAADLTSCTPAAASKSGPPSIDEELRASFSAGLSSAFDGESSGHGSAEPSSRAEERYRGERRDGRDRRDRNSRDRNSRDRNHRDRGSRDRDQRGRYSRDGGYRDENRRSSRASGGNSRRGDSRRGGEASDARPRRRSSHDTFRVYIGQGQDQGMTPELFVDLAKEMADLDSSDMNNLSIRDHYGFVDLRAKQAKLLVESLHGIEYNNQILPVEIATVLRPKASSKPRDLSSSEGACGELEAEKGDDVCPSA